MHACSVVLNQIKRCLQYCYCYFSNKNNKKNNNNNYYHYYCFCCCFCCCSPSRCRYYYYCCCYCCCSFAAVVIDVVVIAIISRIIIIIIIFIIIIIIIIINSDVCHFKSTSSKTVFNCFTSQAVVCVGIILTLLYNTICYYLYHQQLAPCKLICCASLNLLATFRPC